MKYLAPKYSKPVSESFSLLAALPDTFQSDFKVFDCRFYLMQQYYQGGNPPIFEKMIEKAVNESQFYLLIGRGLTPSGKITYFVDLRLPQWDCLDEDAVEGLETKINLDLTDSNTDELCKNEIPVIKDAFDFLSVIKECCYTGNKVNNTFDFSFLKIKIRNPFFKVWDELGLDNNYVIYISDEPSMPVPVILLDYSLGICPILSVTFRIFL